MDRSQISFWHSQLGDPKPRALPESAGPFDVAIVGAGYTGLWTAIYLLRNAPELKVAIFEAETAGFGASGRNGGWCSALFPWAPDQLADRFGDDAAKALRAAMVQTVDEIGEITAELGIDCDFRKAGTHYLVRSKAQQQKAAHELELADRFQIDRLTKVAPDAAPKASAVISSIWDPACASIQPAKLVRGLADTFCRLGGSLFEKTRVEKIKPGQISTERGEFNAEYVVDATEGYRTTLQGKKRSSIPIYSLMIATEPIDSKRLDDLGLLPGITFADYRNLVIYGQRTADNRIAFGGRGAPYHFGSRIKPEYDQVPRIHDQIERVLFELFPQLSGTKIEYRWGGALGVARDWMASVSLDPVTKVGQAGGYVGDGVGTSNLAGRTMADLILGRNSSLTSLCWVNHRSPKWEIEPLRFIAARTAMLGADLADQIEGVTGRRSKISKVIASLTGKG